MAGASAATEVRNSTRKQANPRTARHDGEHSAIVQASPTTGFEKLGPRDMKLPRKSLGGGRRKPCAEAPRPRLRVGGIFHLELETGTSRARRLELYLTRTRTSFQSLTHLLRWLACRAAGARCLKRVETNGYRLPPVGSSTDGTALTSIVRRLELRAGGMRAGCKSGVQGGVLPGTRCKASRPPWRVDL